MDRRGLNAPTIAVFDSGVGGLTVLAPLMEALPGARFIYYADLAHVPYGEKKPAEIHRYMDLCLEALAPYQIDLLLLACNTATSVAAARLRALHPALPIVGMEPAVKPAAGLARPIDKIIVSATDLTLRLEKLERLIEDLGIAPRIERLSLQKLVAFAEAGLFDGPEVERYLREQLAQVDLAHSGTLVLGCTHFIYFAPLLRRLLPDSIQIVDGNLGTVRRVLELLPAPEAEIAVEAPLFLVSGKRPAVEVEAHLQECLGRAQRVWKEVRRDETHDVCH